MEIYLFSIAIEILQT